MIYSIIIIVIVIVLYVPRNESGRMDESKETSRLELWKTIAQIEMDSSSIFYPESVGYVVSRISRGE